MKTNKELYIALAAGVAVAGLVGFLFATEKGKETTRKWKAQGEKLADQLEELRKETKQKINQLKEEILNCNKETSTPQYQQDI